MLVPFENLPEESRIWIYQSNRKFSDAEFSEIETDLQSFLNEWAAHGTSLESSYLLKYNRFIIIAVNQEVQAATGCSIDSSVEFIQNLEKKYNVDLVVCIAAALKRGLLNEQEALRYEKPAFNLAKGFEISGLGQLVDAAVISDRLVTFGG